MPTPEERIAVLETECRNMASNLSSICKNIEGINNTLNIIAIQMAEGRGALRASRWIAKSLYGLMCAFIGLCGGIFGGNVAATQKISAIADKVIK